MVVPQSNFVYPFSVWNLKKKPGSVQIVYVGT